MPHVRASVRRVTTTPRIPIRELQQNAARWIDALSEAGVDQIEVTRRGRVVAVLSRPDPADAILADLVATGAVDRAQHEAASAAAAAEWTPRPKAGRSLSDALTDIREAENR